VADVLGSVANLGRVHCIVGDLNVRLGRVSNDSRTDPYDRARIIMNWMRTKNLEWYRLPQLERSDWIQHLLVESSASVLNKDSSRIFDPFTEKGHPMLQFAVRIPLSPTALPCHQSGSYSHWTPVLPENPFIAPELDGNQRQFNLKFLDHDVSRDHVGRTLLACWETFPTWPSLIQTASTFLQANDE
jgi:hypothetical protein